MVGDSLTRPPSHHRGPAGGTVTPMTRIKTVFHAGCFNAPDEAPAEYLDECLSDGRRLPDLVLTTETYRQHRPAYRELLEPLGYRVTFRDEYMNAWLRETILRRGAKSGSLRRMSREYSGSERWQDPDMFTQRLRVRATGTPLAVDGFHAPSRVQDGSGYKDGTQARAHRATYKKLGAVVGNRAAGVFTIAGADTNVDLRDPVWRARLEGASGLESMWSTVPPVGTHRRWDEPAGTRGIDDISTNGTVVSGGAFKWAGRFDHRAVGAVVEVP